jgi:hypothetical protein
MSSSTPSPTVSATSGPPPTSRRPPRKSTLTQQQKNQKRQRATQDQLLTLEVEFTKNPTPTATVRERIAQDISMTERSVQIWFQNRLVFQSFVHNAATDMSRVGAPKSSCSQRKALKQAKTAMPFRNRCVPTLPIKQSNPASHWVEISSAVLQT